MYLIHTFLEEVERKPLGTIQTILTVRGFWLLSGSVGLKLTKGGRLHVQHSHPNLVLSLLILFSAVSYFSFSSCLSSLLLSLFACLSSFNCIFFNLSLVSQLFGVVSQVLAFFVDISSVSQLLCLVSVLQFLKLVFVCFSAPKPFFLLLYLFLFFLLFFFYLLSV